jgi:hypothetical protein
MEITAQQILAVCGMSSALASAIFWGAYFLGKALNRIERLEEKVEDHEQLLRSFRT